MKQRRRFFGIGEETDQVHGVAPEDFGVGDIQAAVVDAKITDAADTSAHPPAEGIKQRVEVG